MSDLLCSVRISLDILQLERNIVSSNLVMLCLKLWANCYSFKNGVLWFLPCRRMPGPGPKWLRTQERKNPSPLFQCILIPRCPLFKVVYHKICCINACNQYHNLTNLAKKTQVRVGFKTMTNLYITTLCLLTVEWPVLVGWSCKSCSGWCIDCNDVLWTQTGSKQNFTCDAHLKK